MQIKNNHRKVYIYYVYIYSESPKIAFWGFHPMVILW